MADIVKKVDRGIPAELRQAVFTQSDAGAGDVILVDESMGGPAGNVSISADADLTIKFNVYRMLFPPRLGNDLMHSAGEPNLALGNRYQDDQVSGILVAGGETFDNDGEFPVRDIEIVATAGDFEIFLTK
jgi:hypothetical protein